MLPDENEKKDIDEVTIPYWVTCFVIMIFGISVFGFVFFHRYPKSIHDYKLSIKAYQESDLETAEKYIISASNLVPENKEILSFKYYVSGIKKSTEEKYDEAIDLLRQYLVYNSDDSFVDLLITRLEVSKAFDEKNYSLMVEHAAKLYSESDTDPLVILQYASALACEYVDTDNIDDYNKAHELIETARTYDLDDYNLDYIKRIEYRLNTKKIITSEEYHQLEKEGKL